MPNDDLDPDVATNVKQPCCIRCARELRALRSRQARYGQECWSAILAASRSRDIQQSDWTAAQVERALDLMRDGGIVLWRQTARNLIYRSIASDGVTAYLTTKQACNCSAGRWERACYHRLAVVLLDLSRDLTRWQRRSRREKYEAKVHGRRVGVAVGVCAGGV